MRVERVGNTVEIAAPPALARVVFLADDVLRTWVARNGRFTDPANEPGATIVVKTDYPGAKPEIADTDDYYLLTTGALALRIYKEDMRFGLYHPDNATRIVEEVVGLVWDGAVTTQRLTQGANE